MIDTIGSCIKRLFLIQKEKFFPLPDYNLSDRKVTVSIIGKVIDVNYARKLAQMKGLSLAEIMLLDKVQKKKKLTNHEIQILRNKELIEGRQPNIHISSKVASETELRAEYIMQRGIEDDYSKKIILEYLGKFKQGKSRDFEKVLLSKLSDNINLQQKRNKIKNLLQSLKNEGKIVPYGKVWKLSENV
jgi:ATP-dependent DNA helicase RecG